MKLLRNSEVFFNVLFISINFSAFKAQSHANYLNQRHILIQSNPQQGTIQSNQQQGMQKPNENNGLSGSSSSQTDEAMAQEFLEAHNELRAKYGVPPLIWDKALADFAKQYASKLVIDCSMVHSVSKYGENLFWGKLNHWTPKRIVEDWAKESEYFDLKKAVCLKDWTECGHFTQVVWADTIRVGCYRMQCFGTNKGYIGVCSYDPPGNVDKQNPFIKTTPPVTNNTCISPLPSNASSTNSRITNTPPNTPANTNVMPSPPNTSSNDSRVTTTPSSAPTNSSVMPSPPNAPSTDTSVMPSPTNVPSTNTGARDMPQSSL